MVLRQVIADDFALRPHREPNQREGRTAPVLEARAGYEHPAFSPDGRRGAVTIASDTGSDIWIIDLDRGTRIRLTTDGTSAFPVWSQDGTRLAFQSTAAGPWNLYWLPVDGSAKPQAILGSSAAQPRASSPNAGVNLLPGTLPTLSGANPQFPMSWASNHSVLAFHERKPNGERDIWVVTPNGDPEPFLLTPFDERSPSFSSDGRWLAYVSDESGRDEVYVQPFPGPGAKWLISTDGGIDPSWTKDGRELLYRQDEQMMSVSIAPTAEFSAGRPRRLFETRFDVGDNGLTYDVSPDGKWFLMPRSQQGPTPDQLHLVLNWTGAATCSSRPPCCFHLPIWVCEVGSQRLWGWTTRSDPRWAPRALRSATRNFTFRFKCGLGADRREEEPFKETSSLYFPVHLPCRLYSYTAFEPAVQLKTPLGLWRDFR